MFIVIRNGRTLGTHDTFDAACNAAKVMSTMYGDTTYRGGRGTMVSVWDNTRTTKHICYACGFVC